ncbi:MAG TPA: TenA family protein [Thermoanaerobacterales bacterium]|jgi:thiaminase/transcriptional activator TenA|nr:TenA family protein [Thermoanaerobacterales bacterium]
MLSKKLFDENMDIVSACLKHPFLQGMASGKLRREKFVYYMSQDAFYLKAYARAFALGIVKSPDEISMKTFKVLIDGTFDELNLHNNYSEKWGFPLDVTPAKATLNYTDFLIRVATLEDIACIAAATLPCSILYAYLGTKLAKTYDPTTPYKNWIETYSSEEFKKGTNDLEFILHKYGEESRQIRSNYRRAMELEYDFFDEAYKS